VQILCPDLRAGKLFDSGPFIILLFRIRYFSEGILLRDGCVFTNKRGYCCRFFTGGGVNLEKSAALVLRIVFFHRLEIPHLRPGEGVCFAAEAFRRIHHVPPANTRILDIELFRIL